MKYTEYNGKQVKLDDLCQLIYAGFGQQAVLSFCDGIGWQVWQVCDACETESPFSDDPEERVSSCLVCGSYNPSNEA